MAVLTGNDDGGGGDGTAEEVRDDVLLGRAAAMRRDGPVEEEAVTRAGTGRVGRAGAGGRRHEPLEAAAVRGGAVGSSGPRPMSP